jgi:hypothetical protein
MDCLATEDYEDFSWDAIWDSEVALKFGWVVEMKIPYAALRFSKPRETNLGLKLCGRETRVQKYLEQLILKLSGDSAGWYS